MGQQNNNYQPITYSHTPAFELDCLCSPELAQVLAAVVGTLVTASKTLISDN